MLKRYVTFAAFGLGCAVWTAGFTSGQENEIASKKPTAGAIGLKGYHSKAILTFSRTPGFGVVRVPRMFLKIKSDVVKISLSELDQLSPLNGHPKLSKINADFNAVFAAGKIANPRKTTGFIRLDDSKKGVNAKEKPKSWKIDTIDLVGLMASEKPVVYQSAYIWAEAILKHTKSKPASTAAKSPSFKRLPDMFEWAGLDYLEKGNDLFVYTNGSHLRMLGALRATDRCTKCHSVEQGDLLGALSYTMKKMK